MGSAVRFAVQPSSSAGSGGPVDRLLGSPVFELVRRSPRLAALDPLAELDEGELVAGHLVGELLALLRVLDLHQLVGVRQRVLAQRHELPDLGRCVGEAQPVLEVALVLAHLLGELPDAVPVLADHAVVHRRLVERRDVLALEVLDDRDLERGVVVDVLDDRGDRQLARDLRRAPAALARDQLEAAVVERSDEDRLQDAVLADGRRHLLEGFLVERHARVLRVGFDAVDRDDANALVAMRVLRGEEADDRGRERAFLGQSPSGCGAEVRPGQVRSPPGRVRDRCELRPTSPRMT